MTKADVLVERGADRLQQLADRAAARGDGVGEWLSEELRNDAAFLRKLKPSLMKARAQGNASTNQEPAAPPPTPKGPQLGSRPTKKKRRKGGKGPAPLVVVGAALVAGIVLAKVVDWRGHAHPRD
jgi:ferric-dicitrate binding protein FerR (iron transport regulator)